MDKENAVHTHNEIHTKKNEILPFATKQMELGEH
jgi:hypothetical protein